jgi:hypothetical protein
VQSIYGLFLQLNWKETTFVRGEKIYVKTSFNIPLREPKEQPKIKNMSMWRQIQYNVIKSITSILKFSTYIITSSITRPFGLALILVLSLSTFKTSIILYIIIIYKLDKHIHLKCSCQTSTKRYFLIDVLLDCNKFRITYIHIKQMLPHDVMLFINYINILKVIFYTISSFRN